MARMSHPNSWRRNFRPIVLRAMRHASAIALAVACTVPLLARPLNVLLIAVDDLRPDLGCYGHPSVQTPNIDRLARQSLQFNRAYCQVSQCNQSRTAFLTGLRPDRTKVYGLYTNFRDELPDAVTLPQYFKQHGYHVQGLGKIFHKSMNDDRSWSVPVWFPPGSPGGTALAYGPEGRAALNRANAKSGGRATKKGPAWEAANVTDNQLPDGATADRAIGVLREIKDRPFFLAVGFVKPHLPFVAPKRYWDLYATDDVFLSGAPESPQGAPEYASRSHDELVSYLDMPRSPSELTTDQRRQLVHGYWAATSYIDAQIGRVLQYLDELDLRKSTVVVLWGDHGFHLGEQGMWGKTSNYEAATRVPLLVSVPGHQKAAASTDALVELVDVYPSLAEICGLPVPTELEGTSFKPLLTNPSRPWKKGALSQFLRPADGRGPVMGRALRTDRYRLVEWRSRKNVLIEYELYEYNGEQGETTNLARQPDQATNVQQLSELLNRGWPALRP